MKGGLLGSSDRRDTSDIKHTSTGGRTARKGKGIHGLFSELGVNVDITYLQSIAVLQMLHCFLRLHLPSGQRGTSSLPSAPRTHL